MSGGGMNDGTSEASAGAAHMCTSSSATAPPRTAQQIRFRPQCQVNQAFLSRPLARLVLVLRASIRGFCGGGQPPPGAVAPALRQQGGSHDSATIQRRNANPHHICYSLTDPLNHIQSPSRAPASTCSCHLCPQPPAAPCPATPTSSRWRRGAGGSQWSPGMHATAASPKSMHSTRMHALRHARVRNALRHAGWR